MCEWGREKKRRGERELDKKRDRGGGESSPVTQRVH